MINVVRCGHTFSHRCRLQPARPDVPHRSATKPIPADGDPLAKKRLYRPIPPNDRTIKEWKTIAWPTNIQSRTPDGKFGPAMMMDCLSDCWFMASLAALANDEDGHKILAERIKKVSVGGIGGYHVTFAGSQNIPVFISDQELENCLDTNGGDADTRLMELAADKFFKERGHFKSLYIATLLKWGENQEEAEQCFQAYCRDSHIQDPETFNPMRDGGHDALAYFMLTGITPDFLKTDGSSPLQRSDIMAYLNRYFINNRDGASVVINGEKNALGGTSDAENIAIDWDVIRTEITRDGRLRKQEWVFLNALDKWLETRDANHLKALMSAAENLRLQHINSVEFVNALSHNQSNMNQEHFNLLRSGAQEVLAGGSGYIGFPGGHCGTIEGINEAANTFTYSEPNFATVVHTGELSRLIQSIENGHTWLSAVDPTTEQDEAESSHAGEQRGRHLRQIHHQVVRDGKIDPAESGPLANLMEMDDGAFRQLYDSDINGVIEGGELKAVQLRVDHWVDHFKSTPIW